MFRQPGSIIFLQLEMTFRRVEFHLKFSESNGVLVIKNNGFVNYTLYQKNFQIENLRKNSENIIKMKIQ